MKVTVIPGVGPATAERLRRAGVHTVADLEAVSEEELVRLVGQAHGIGLWRLARAHDDRPVEPERETKSVSVEGTYEDDLTDRRLHGGPARPGRPATSPSGCASTACPAARSRIKVRLHDFTTLSRSTTLPSPTDNGAVVARLARTLLADLDTSGGVRLLGVGVSGLADWVQDDLFGVEPEPRAGGGRRAAARARAGPGPPGMDVEHAEMGRGWVWGSGQGVVTVRFETAETGPGPVRSYRADDPDLAPSPPSRSRREPHRRRPGRSCAQRSQVRRRTTTPTTG